MIREAPRQTKRFDGTKLCRLPGCGNPVKPPMQSYCSPSCREKFSIAYFPSSTRWHVFQRDRGVCSICGTDTEKLRRILKTIRPRIMAQRIARELGYHGSYSKGHFWQADHIRECVRGGWGTGLENLRTACTPCHRAETARLARERAEERKFTGSLFPVEAER